MMTDTRRAEAETDRGEPETQSAPGGTGEATAAEADPREKLAREASDLKDRLLRTLAEMENLRRRTEREVADTRTYAVASFARDVLGVADNMARALQAPATELRQRADAGVKALLDGIELTERELLKVLEKHGVRKFEPHGERFDPNLHQAMYEVPDSSLPSGTVAHVVQAGYMIGDRVLRPALVAVAKGAPKTSAPSNDNANAGPPDPNNAA
jgi:molecular chaperone GrpE